MSWMLNPKLQMAQLPLNQMRKNRRKLSQYLDALSKSIPFLPKTKKIASFQTTLSALPSTHV